ncbi:hypothetical protein JCM9279_003388 [Rhodotorula babjevae]
MTDRPASRYKQPAWSIGIGLGPHIEPGATLQLPYSPSSLDKPERNTAFFHLDGRALPFTPPNPDRFEPRFVTLILSWYGKLSGPQTVVKLLELAWGKEASARAPQPTAVAAERPIGKLAGYALLEWPTFSTAWSFLKRMQYKVVGVPFAIPVEADYSFMTSSFNTASSEGRALAAMELWEAGTLSPDELAGFVTEETDLIRQAPPPSRPTAAPPAASGIPPPQHTTSSPSAHAAAASSTSAASSGSAPQHVTSSSPSRPATASSCSASFADARARRAPPSRSSHDRPVTSTSPAPARRTTQPASTEAPPPRAGFSSAFTHPPAPGRDTAPSSSKIERPTAPLSPPPSPPTCRTGLTDSVRPRPTFGAPGRSRASPDRPHRRDADPLVHTDYDQVDEQTDPGERAELGEKGREREREEAGEKGRGNRRAHGAVAAEPLVREGMNEEGREGLGETGESGGERQGEARREWIGSAPPEAGGGGRDMSGLRWERWQLPGQDPLGAFVKVLIGQEGAMVLLDDGRGVGSKIRLARRRSF